MTSTNEPSADALDLLLYHWGEFPELELRTDGEADPGYFLLRELERAGYLWLSRASTFSHKIALTKSGAALVRLLPPLEKDKRLSLHVRRKEDETLQRRRRSQLQRSRP